MGNLKSNIVIFGISALLAIIVGFLLANAARIGIPAALGIGFMIFLIPLIWGKPEFGLALIAFFLPFERIPTIDIGGISLKINHALIALVFGVFIIKTLTSRQLVIPRDPVRLLIAFFVVTLMLSIGNAVNIERSLQVLAFILFMGVIYLTVTLVVSGKKALIMVLYGLFAGAVFQGAFGLFQFAGDAVGLPISVTLLKEGYDKVTFGFARIQGTAMEPLYLANYIFIPMFTGIVLLLRGQGEKIFPKWFMYLVCGVLLLCFILTVSRGAYIGLALAIIVLLISQLKLIVRAKTILTTVLIVLIVAVGSYLGLAKSEPRALEEFVGHVTVNDIEIGESVVSRVGATAQAYELFQESPIIGIGLGNFGPRVQNDPDSQPEGGWFIVNNEYMELLSENGVVGLGMFLILMIVVLYRAMRAIRKTNDEFLKSVLIGLSLALIGILGQYLTFSTLYIIHIWFLLGLISAVTYMSLREKPSRAIE